MFSINLSSCLNALLCIIIIFVCVAYTVIVVIFIFILSYVCHLLIFSPLHLFNGGSNEVRAIDLMPNLCGFQMMHPDLILTPS